MCLVRDHKVASCCRDPLRCFRCNCSGHLSKHCARRCSLDSRRRVMDNTQSNRLIAALLTSVSASMSSRRSLGAPVSSSGEMLEVDTGVAVMTPNSTVVAKLVDFGDWMPHSPCQVACSTRFPMLEEEAMAPLLVSGGMVSWKESRDDLTPHGVSWVPGAHPSGGLKPNGWPGHEHHKSDS